MTPVDRQGRILVDDAAGRGRARPRQRRGRHHDVGQQRDGHVQPIADVVAIAREHGIPVHSDAVQAAGYLPLDFARVAASTP